jgi:hypothetical protein
MCPLVNSQRSVDGVRAGGGKEYERRGRHSLLGHNSVGSWDGKEEWEAVGSALTRSATAPLMLPDDLLGSAYSSVYDDHGTVFSGGGGGYEGGRLYSDQYTGRYSGELNAGSESPPTFRDQWGRSEQQQEAAAAEAAAFGGGAASGASYGSGGGGYGGGRLYSGSFIGDVHATGSESSYGGACHEPACTCCSKKSNIKPPHGVGALHLCRG